MFAFITVSVFLASYESKKFLIAVPLEQSEKPSISSRKYRVCTQQEGAREGLKAMATRSRGRHRKNNTAGNTRMDAALDAMRPFGFDDGLVRHTVDELLDVYEGSQGWPFIEEASYKLLIETILGKQQISSEEEKENDFLQDNATREGDTEASAATLTTAISEAGSSNLVAQESLLQTCDGLNSVPQTNDAQDSASLDGRDSTRQTKREGIRVEPENPKKPVDDAIGSTNRELGSKHVERTFVRPPVIQSSQLENLPIRRRKPCYGWISDTDEKEDENLPIRRRKPCYGWISDTDEKEDLIHFPLPPLPEELQKLLEQRAAPQSGTRRRRKSRWDEKPNDMTT